MDTGALMMTVTDQWKLGLCDVFLINVYFVQRKKHQQRQEKCFYKKKVTFNLNQGCQLFPVKQIK